MTPEEQKREEGLTKNVGKRLYELMTAALSLVAALAWNDAVQSLFKQIFGDVGSVYAKFLYAIFITVLVVIVSTRLAKLAKHMQELEEKRRQRRKE
jgi:hypothetical protein